MGYFCFVLVLLCYFVYWIWKFYLGFNDLHGFCDVLMLYFEAYAYSFCFFFGLFDLMGFSMLPYLLVLEVCILPSTFWEDHVCLNMKIIGNFDI